MTHENQPPTHILAVIPAQRAFVALMSNGKVCDTAKVPSHATPIGAYLDALYQRIGDVDNEQITVVIQAAPFSPQFLTSESNVRYARQLSETAIRWVAICEQDSVFYFHVNRGRWLKSLSEHPAALTFPAENGETRLDVASIAKKLNVYSSEFADVTCLAYWYYLIGWQTPHGSEEDKPNRERRRQLRRGGAAA